MGEKKKLQEGPHNNDRIARVVQPPQPKESHRVLDDSEFLAQTAGADTASDLFKNGEAGF